MTSRLRRLATVGVAAASMGFGMALVTAGPAHAADPTDLVINEMMTKACAASCQAGYTPVDAAYEFIELYNRGPDDIDISGWAFTAGISLDPASNPLNPAGTVRVFPPGTVIHSHQYFVGSSNGTVFTAVSGQTADFSFAPSGLSSSGETVTLVDAAGATVESLTYAAASPWPSLPNGLGPSLELTDPFANPTVGGNWGVSATSVGTPHAQNSSFGPPPPNITGVAANPARPLPTDDVTVQATLPKGIAATLTYKVMFGNDVPIAFKDDAGSVGGANDGTYSAVIPHQPAGNLIRYKITANANGTALSYPGVGDTRSYDGVVVRDTSVENSAQLPVFEWFLDDASYNQLARPVCDDVNYTGVITWQGKVYDNSTFRRRGHTSCVDPKPKIEMQLPAGYTIDFNGSVDPSFFAEPMSGLVDEFALQSEAYPVPGLGWDHIGDLKDPTVGYLPVRSQRNAAFFGAGAILEEYDGSWRGRNGMSDGAFYKVEAGGFRTYSTAAALLASGDFAKKDPDDTDYTDAWQLTQMLNQAPSAAKTAWIWANINVPEMVEYMATTVEIRHWDSGGKNFYVFRDASSTGRWQILSWDLDGIFSGGSDIKGDFITPDITGNKLYKSLFEIPQIKEMYFRRLRTLHDQYLTGTGFQTRFNQLTAGKDADRVLDKNKWGGATLSSRITKVDDGVKERRTQIAAHTNATEVPTSQSANPNVVINEIHPQPATATGNEEYLELYNPSTTEAVDISGWQIKGVGSGDGLWTIPNGTVINKGGYVVFVSHDSDVRAAYGNNLFIGGQFPGGLSSSGEQIQLLRGATVVDDVTYSPGANGWPGPLPATGGPSLELKNPTLDNANPANWALSTNGGTPNAQNTAFGGGGGGGGGTGCSAANPSLDLGDTWCYMATGGDLGTAWRAEGYDDSAWPSGPGILGFKNSPLATTIPATNGRTTYYFRTKVDVADASTISSATLNAVIDDGAVVYVNGTEAARSNLAAGAVSFTQKALVDVTGAAENTPIPLTLPTNLFHTGTNTIAVEVHNKANAPGDLGFDAELKFNTGGGGGGGGGVVVDYGATWKYLDTGVDQGTAWRAAAFNDGSWASGPGALGFGNTPLGTTLSKAQKRTTYYFRRTFDVTGAVSTATLELLRDDGAVVYIDGTEVARTNMPAGTITFATQASTEITGAAEKNAVTLTLPTAGLTVGTHTMAIEVHQFGNAAGDLSMDARLTLG